MSDAQLLITENIDVWTSAIKQRSTTGRGSSKKIELAGIKKLRELILELAVRGKLITQDANDEPASVLLEKIAAEKAQLIKDKKIKKTKALSEIGEDEKPFELPSSWEWVKLGNISHLITDGAHHTPKYIDKGVPFLSVKDMSSGTLSFSDTRFISHEQHADLTKRCHPEKGDLLLTKIGTTGVPIVINTDIEFSIFVSVALIKFPVEKLEGDFLSLLIKSPLVKKQSEEGTEGVGNKNLVLRKIAIFNLALPPLAEQHRIVAKVDELMGLCDQLEQQTEDSITAHQTLAETLLATLSNSETPAAFNQNWTRIAEHFDTLFTTEHSIDQLKQTILQLAVMGKLVPQNPNEEPASVLLEKIAAEKEQLIKDKKIKKQKPLPAITEDEKPFELPKVWEWSKLGNVAILKGGFAYKSTLFVGTGEHQVIRMGNIRLDRFRLDEKAVFIKDDLANSTQEYEILSGDILLTMTGTKGKRDYLYSLMVDDCHLTERRLYLNQRLCVARPLLTNSTFVNLLLKEDRLLGFVYAKSTGTANQANIGMEALMNWVVPLPPVKEQIRISKKVEELMALCEQLKTRLSDSQITQLQFADSIVEQSVN